MYESFVVGADGQRIACNCVCPTRVPLISVASDTVASENIVRKFDPLGVNVNGGGKQPYNYDSLVLQNAFSLLSEEAQLLFLVGQSRPDGTYEYGIKEWTEVIVPPEV